MIVFCEYATYVKYCEIVRLMRKYTWILLLLSLVECHNFRCYVTGQ